MFFIAGRNTQHVLNEYSGSIMVPYKPVSRAGFEAGTVGVPLLEFEVAP